VGEACVHNKGDKTTHLMEEAIHMVVSELVLAGIETDFVERKIDSKVVDSHFHDEIFIFIRRDFLDMFEVRDGVNVGGELLSPCWGKYLDDNLDGLPYWMTQVKYKTVDKDRPSESLEEIEKAMAYLERRIKN